MSKRRKPGETVRRRAGSGFIGSAAPELVRIPEVNHPLAGDGDDWCMLDCGDHGCREYPNVQVVTSSGERTDDWLFHISECQMDDVPGGAA